MPNRPYIMISYNWEHQPIIKDIRYRLWEEGYNVWIDVEKMAGRIDDAMAKAVKGAEVVLPCLSKKFEDSENCSSEGACIKVFKKPFIPLLMERDYKQDNWVAATFGRHVYVNFSNTVKFDEKFQELLIRLKSYPSLSPQKSNRIPTTLHPTTAQAETPDPPTSSDHESASSNTTSSVMPEVSTAEFNQILVDLSKWWKDFGSVFQLKLLIMDFSTIRSFSYDILSDCETPKDAFRLLFGLGIIKPSKIDVLVEATILFGLQGVEDIIRKKVALPDFDQIEIGTNNISIFRQNLFHFTNKLTRDNKETIGQLYGIRVNPKTDIWSLILQLETDGIFKDMNTFIEKLNRNGMGNATKEFD